MGPGFENHSGYRAVAPWLHTFPCYPGLDNTLLG
jgi:hypothetical protein